MENKMDSRILGTLKALAVLVALASVFVTDIAVAEYRPYKYFEHHGYDSELQHCVELLRPTLNAPADGKIQYLLQEVKLRGPWYRFEIQASVFDSDGAVSLDGFKVLCKSNRWIESARLIERRNKPAVKRQLVVTTSSELVVYRAMASNSPDSNSAQ